MKNSEDIKKDVEYILGAKGHFSPLSLELYESYARKLNPKEGITPKDIKALLSIKAEHNKILKKLIDRIDIFPGVIKFFGPISNPQPRLLNEIVEIKEMIHALNIKILEISRISFENNLRIQNDNLKLYWNHILENKDLQKIVAEILDDCKKDVERYEKAIKDLSDKLDLCSRFLADVRDTTLLGLYQSFFELSHLRERAQAKFFWYHQYLQNSANDFVLRQYETKSEKKALEPHRKQAWLEDLINAYQDEFNRRETLNSLNLDVPDDYCLPNHQLIAFIRHVLMNPKQFDSKVQNIVKVALARAGNDPNSLEEAFNTDDAKDYGLLKSDRAIELLAGLQVFLDVKLSSDSTNSNESEDVFSKLTS